VDISANNGNFAAVTSAGNVYALGNGSKGQLGDGTTPEHRAALAPMTLPPGVTAKQVSVGGEFSLILCHDGRLFATGADNLMQLGQGLETLRAYSAQTEVGSASGALCSSLPLLVQPPGGEGRFVSASAGEDFSVAVWERGGKRSAVTFGNGVLGQLGHSAPTHLSPPKMVGLLEGKQEWDGEKVITLDVQAVAAGREHVLALLSNGAVLSWGANRKGQLGTGSLASSRVPALVMPLQQYKIGKVFAGARGSAAVVA